MAVTIRDVAREAGVSVATVSRVFTNSAPVREDTRRRVREVARRLRYVPHGGARSLPTRTTSTVGVLLPDLYGEFFSEVIRGIDETSRPRGYHLLVSGSHADRSEAEAVLRALRGRVDGLILMSPDIDASALDANLPDTLPVVLLNCSVNGGGYDTIRIDNSGGASAMVRHLLGLGHRRIALIRGPERNLDAQERLRGFRQAMAGAEAVEVAGDFTEAGGYRAVQSLLGGGPLPTAVFAANDATAIGALSALREAGYRVPQDMALTGFDDIPFAPYITPSLTTVHVGIARLGQLAVERVLHAVERKNQHERQQSVLETWLVIRESCGGRALSGGDVGREPRRRPETGTAPRT
jgi:LacI family transcriptional regulator